MDALDLSGVFLTYNPGMAQDGGSGKKSRPKTARAKSARPKTAKKLVDLLISYAWFLFRITLFQILSTGIDRGIDLHNVKKLYIWEFLSSDGNQNGLLSEVK